MKESPVLEIPYQLTCGMGLRGKEALVAEDWPHNLWVRKRRQNILRHKLEGASRHRVLAHELGHGHHRNVYSEFDSDDSRGECRGAAFAALLLISPVEYRPAEKLHGPSIADLARTLDVIPLPDPRVARRTQKD